MGLSSIPEWELLPWPLVCLITELCSTALPNWSKAEVLPASQVQDGQFQIVINVPENAGEALEALVVQPQETGILFSVLTPPATEAYITRGGCKAGDDSPGQRGWTDDVCQ